VCQVQQQILNHKLPKEYYYFHDTPAPWAQMDILRLVRSTHSSHTDDYIIDLVVQTMEQPFNRDHSIGQAVIFECIQTLAMILQVQQPPNPFHMTVLTKAMKYLRYLIKSEQCNDQYVGLCALEILFNHQENSMMALVTDEERECF